MAVGRGTGRAAGLSVSLGIGLAIVIGGLSEAAAEPTDSSSASSTSSADSGSDEPTKRSAESAGTDDKPSNRSEREGPEARSPSRDKRGSDEDSADGSQRRSTVAVTDHDSDEAVTDTASPEPDDDPAPVQSQAVPVMMAAARRPSLDVAEVTSDPPLATSTTLVPEPDSTANVDSPPVVTASVADPDPLSGATRVTVTADDPEPDALTYTTTRPILGTVAAGVTAGEFTYTPTRFGRILARFLPFVRSDRFSVTVTDSQGAATSVRVTTTIVPINSAPRPGAVTIGSPNSSSGIVTGTAKATDPNWDRIHYLAATAETTHGSVTVRSNGTFTYTPTAAARHRAAAVAAGTADRTDTFTVTVSDEFGALTHIPVTVRIAPTNTAPTGTADVEGPDPGDGVVTGTVLGFDPDGDTLTYSGPTATLKGTVVVHDDGSFSYTPSDTARYHAAHPQALSYDTSDSFRVTVDDGHGGLTTIPVSVVISPGAEAVAVPPLSTFCGCILMPADTIFRADLRDLPAMPESETWIRLLGGDRGATLRAAWAGNEWMGSTGGMPVNVVGADHPTEDVVFNRGYSTTGPGIDDRPYAIPDRPLVEGMPSFPAWDRHLLVFQEGTCISQELYNVANGVELPGAGLLDILGNAAYAAIWGSSWIAEAGAQYDMSSPLYPEIGHANASRLPYLPMILRPDDLERGYIDHMLGITIAKDVGAGYVWPARAGDGSAEDGIPMGTVLRLRGDVDISQYAQSTQVILRALQVHGAVVFDSKGAGTDGAGLLAMSNGWADTDYVTAKSELNTIPINLFEAVDAASLALDPAAGWQIR
ncbi:Ig-like domain-containing protein [Mycolicibacterium hippocampi]|uniref:Ig-like domain-containing protein n=1 Tax=Mycolicibacterium hippocampi TaxID=659824 RepID=UPI0013D5D244|nr:Ig-like domain-containing protein [Mycolicibacterium hippocampi]